MRVLRSITQPEQERLLKVALIVTLQAFTGSLAFMLGALSGLPWDYLVPFGLLLALGLLPQLRRDGAAICGKMMRRGAWSLSLVCFTVAGWHLSEIDLWNSYYAWMAWLAGIELIIGRCLVSFQDLQWKKSLAFAWIGTGTIIWCAAAYTKNVSLDFYIGLLLVVVELVAARIIFKLSPVVIQALNTGILLTVLVPVVDAGFRWNESYSEVAKPPDRHTAGDSAPFAEWWTRYLEAWDIMGRDIFEPDTEGIFRFRLKPGSVGHLMDSRISINRNGFRGPEIVTEKGDTYRIVVVGESTTFGCTLQENERPWPEILEDMIRERLAPQRPVEVVNAGVPAYSLRENVLRFEKHIRPLHPDLIISYHGYNGFPLFLKDFLRRDSVGATPAYRNRPLVLLANLEYRIRTKWQELRSAYEAMTQPASSCGLMETGYAQYYRQLLALAKQKGTPLILCSFSMAVNQRSPTEKIDFYRTIFPQVEWDIKSNQIHSAIVAQLARTNPSVGFVDTRPALDGQWVYYIDLVHFTQEGRQRLVETVYARIEPRLREALAADGQ